MMSFKDLWTRDVGPRWRWQTILLVVVLAVVLALVALTCSSSHGSVAQAAAPDDGAVIPAPTPLVDQGTPLAVRGAGPCWVWNPPGWQVKNLLGKVMYRWTIDVEWCANTSRTKVTDIVYHHCLDTGGYFTFDGCSKDHGQTGFSTYSSYDLWRYHFVINGLLFNRTPSVDFKLGADGGVTGTVYYDD